MTPVAIACIIRATSGGSGFFSIAGVFALTGKEIRSKFLDFFAARDHKILPSASLIPADDPSLLWTAAGMVPFKPYFTGAAVPPARRIATCQKCLRTPDIEMVGRTPRHHTFFEMLGNFSFGDYFKEKAIPWAWEFVTQVLELPRERLYISVYQDDDEAYDHWRSLGIPAERIVRLGKKTNFWEIGVGPCGPCSEIYYDLGPEAGCGLASCGPGCDCDRYLEIWNLVFIQYFHTAGGEYVPLKDKGIDTGMGLERVASVVQGVRTNFETDLFRGIIAAIENLLHVRLGATPEGDVALKVIADHARACTFAIADGALPSNEGRGYVIRRLLRRAVRYGVLLGRQEPFLDRVAAAVIQEMKDVYPELGAREKDVLRVIRLEENRFRETLTQGIQVLDRLIAEARAKGARLLAGEDAFRLYDTYGFPLELTREISAEHGLEVDEEGFRVALERQKQQARAARRETHYLSEEEAFYKALREEIGGTTFVGYEQTEATGQVRAIVKDGELVAAAGAGEEVEVLFDVTPCYAEGGGQVSDVAQVEGETGRGRVNSVFKPVDDFFVHRLLVERGTFKTGDRVTIAVDRRLRRGTAQHHTATHLLHRALKEVLGGHANQAGSLVAPDRLRFDFTHYQALSAEELARVEDLVNAKVAEDLPVEAFYTTLEEAKKMGAIALFGEKYGARVRVVRIGDFSMELCGGTHLSRTGGVGIFKITAETGIGAGVRRIEAVAGESARRYLNGQEQQLQEAARLLKTSPREVLPRLRELLHVVEELSRENETLKDRLAVFEVRDLMRLAEVRDGVKVLVARVASRDMAGMRSLLDLLREQLGPAVVVLGSVHQDRVQLVAGASKDLVARGVHAGRILKEISPLVEGGGGGRPDMAQAGGKNPAGLDTALQRAKTIISQELLGKEQPV